MKIYKVIHIQHEEYEVIVKATDKKTAMDLAAECAFDSPPVDSHWYDSEIEDEWEEDDPLAPEPNIEEIE